MDQNVTKANEDYLEAMLVLKKRLGYIRSVDVAELLNVAKPSVSYMTKQLRSMKLIEMDPGNLIHLTAEGQKIAEKVYCRHQVLSNFLISLGVSEKNATKDACMMEHDISRESFTAICKFIQDNNLISQEDFQQDIYHVD